MYLYNNPYITSQLSTFQNGGSWMNILGQTVDPSAGDMYEGIYFYTSPTGET